MLACCSMPASIRRLVGFTMQDRGVFRDPSQSIVAKVRALIKRCCAIGLTVPSENTLKELAALMACAHLPDANPGQLYGIVTEMKVWDSAGTPNADASYRTDCSQCDAARQR